MLVDCVEMWKEGAPRPRAEIMAAVPVRGLLTLSPQRPGWYPGKKNPPQLAGLVAPGKAEWLLPPLDPAWVKVIRNGALLIIGEQDFERHRTVKAVRQTWWCRIVTNPVIPSIGAEWPNR